MWVCVKVVCVGCVAGGISIGNGGFDDIAGDIVGVAFVVDDIGYSLPFRCRWC